MIPGRRFVVPVVGAGALAALVANGAFARGPGPFHRDAQAHAKTTTVRGNLRVTNVSRVDKNMSVYGRVYAHGGEQIWSGLLVRSGIKADSLDVAGPIAAQSATIANNLQTGTLQATTINGGTLALSGTGASAVAGAFNVAGRLTGNGVDAGAGGFTTTGTISGGQITSQGQLTAGSLATNGTLTAGTATFNNMTVSGNVNFANANVTGLSLSNLTGNIASLSVGNQSSGNAPLSLSANGKTVNLGVDTSGNLTLGSVLASGALGVGGNATVGGTLGVGGNLTVGGATGITTAALTAPASSTNVNAPGTLTLNGSSINLAGAATVSGGLTLASGNDLTATTTTGTNASATHFLANGDKDVAGIATLSVGGSAGAGTEQTVSVTFTKSFTTPPAVTITPLDDPNPGNPAASKQWVTLTQASGGAYTGFTIHHIATNGAGASGYQVRYAYQVVGA